MIHHRILHHAKRLHHQFLPHNHQDGQQHHAHGLSLLALFLYLQIFVVTSAGFYVIKLKAPQILGAVAFSAQQIIDLTNQKRVENGLPALSYNPLLAQAASAKAANMFAENYWAHNSPSGKTPWVFITGAGYKYVYAGENLARDFSDATSVVNAWMNSPSHRENLLAKNFKEIGVAVSEGKLTGVDGILVVQEFGTPVSSVPNTAALAQASPVPSPVASASPKQIAAASVVPSPSPSPVESPAASPAGQIAQNAQIIVPASTDSTADGSAVVLASRQFSISKFISLGLVGFVFLLFVSEVILVMRNEKLRLRSEVIAHLGILAFALLVIWYAVSGSVL